jgi:hypothetical protein
MRAEAFDGPRTDSRNANLTALPVTLQGDAKGDYSPPLSLGFRIDVILL